MEATDSKEKPTATLKVTPSLRREIDLESGRTGEPMYELTRKAWEFYIECRSDANQPMQLNQQPQTSTFGHDVPGFEKLGVADQDRIKAVVRVLTEEKSKGALRVIRSTLEGIAEAEANEPQPGRTQRQVR